MSTYERVSAAHLGENRGRARLYLQGKWLLRADFEPGRLISAVFEKGRVTLRLDDDGERRVSGKKEGSIPVIDVTGAELREALGDDIDLVVRARSGELVITPARTAQKRATRCQNGLEGALFAGGGFLSEAAKQAGFQPAFAVEWDERYAEIYERNHPTAKVFNCSISEVDVAELPEIELLTIGIPCEPYSSKRRNKSDLPPESHDLGDMVFWALRIVDALNPATVLVEEVPGFLESGAGWILRRALERMGYTVSARIVDPASDGELAGRQRAVIVATTDVAFEWPAVEAGDRRLGEILDASDASTCEWFDESSKPWLFAHWKKQTAKGNGFASQQLTADTTRVQTISKRYFNGQGDAPVVCHPTRPDTYRWLTVDEVARLHGVPANYYLGSCKTVAGEVLGQAVVVPTFRRILEAVRS